MEGHAGRFERSTRGQSDRRQILPEMHPGDRLITYETGDRRSAVATASVISDDATDLKNPAVQMKAGEPLANPITLAQMK